MRQRRTERDERVSKKLKTSINYCDIFWHERPKHITIIFLRWREVLSGGLVRGDSRKKNDLLHKDATYMSVSQLKAVQIYP